MTKLMLTDRFLKNLKPADPGTRAMFWDALVPHLAVRITDKGAKSFIVLKRPKGGKLVGITLGRYPTVGLAEARERAREVLGSLAKGKSPQRRDRFAEVAEDFVRDYLPRLRSRAAIEARIRHKLLPRWGDAVASELLRRDVVLMVKEVTTADGPGAALSTLAAARSLFSWAIDQDCYAITSNPCSGRWQTVLTPMSARERVLTDAEIKAIWRACGEIGYPFGPLFQLLLLSGQRRGELAGLRWAEVDLKGSVMVIPAGRTKGRVEQSVPLAPMSLELLHGLPRYPGGEFAFTADGLAPVCGFVHVKARLDAAAGVTDWVLHDLRRTVRTRLAALGVSPIVAEAVIGHKQKGIIGIYDRHSYDREKRDALERWEMHLAPLLTHLHTF